MSSIRSQFDDLLRGFEVTVISDLAAKFMYQGFNAEQVMSHLMAMKVKHSVGDKDFVRDILDLITLGAIMGNYNANNKTKISDDGQKIAEALMKKYEIKEGGAKGNREAVNVPRVMATFPDLTVQVVSKVPFERNYGNEFRCVELPKFMKTSVFPAIIPKTLETEIKKALLIAATCYSSEQTMALRQTTDTVAAYGAQKKFTQLSHDSIYPKEEDRIALIKTFIFDVTAIHNVVAKCNELLGLPVPTVITNANFQAAGLVVKGVSI